MPIDVQFILSTASEVRFEPSVFSCVLPDTFAPSVGDRIWIDYTDHSRQVCRAHMYVVEVAWHIRLPLVPGPSHVDRSAAMRVLIACPPPDGPPSERRGVRR